MTACTRTVNLSSASASPTAPPRVDFELIRTLLGRGLIDDRWEQWQPAIGAIGDGQAYPMFGRLVAKMRAAV